MLIIVPAFNAALTVFACFVVCLPTSTITTTPPPPYSNSETLVSLRKANDALAVLDRENVTIERCRHYINLLIDATGKLGETLLPSAAHMFEADTVILMCELPGEPPVTEPSQNGEDQALDEVLLDPIGFPDLASGFNFGLDSMLDFRGLDDAWYQPSIN